MDTLKQGDIVKSKTSDQEMVINRKYVDKGEFNKSVLGYIIDDKDINEEKVWIYVCFIEENGLTKKCEFKRDELIFVRRGN